jgi:hypothetical protein
VFSVVGCATAVVPDGAAPDIKTDDDAGGSSSDNSYASGGDSGSSSPADAGKTTPPKGDSGTSTGSCSFTGALAAYDFTGESGDQTSTTATSTAPGVAAGNVKRAGTLTAVSGADSINASGWATASHADTTKYYTLSVTPPSGCSLDITSISIDTSASGSGPSTGAVATSEDSFGAMTTFTTGATHNNTLSVSGSTSAVEIRIYGYSASSSAGTMRMQSTLTVTGSLK